MESESLIRKLNSIGKEAFIVHYNLFKDYSQGNITKDIAIQNLVKEGRSNPDGASIRLSNSKIIFSENQTCEALMIIKNSKRLSKDVIELAKSIYKNDCGLNQNV